MNVSGSFKSQQAPCGHIVDGQHYQDQRTRKSSSRTKLTMRAAAAVSSMNTRRWQPQAHDRPSRRCGASG